MTVPESAITEPRLAPELDDLLVELSVTLQKYGMYPHGHPLLESAIAALVARCSVVLSTSGELLIAVARDRLIVNGVPTEKRSAVLREFAERLFRRDVGAIRIMEGVVGTELAEMLNFIARGVAPQSEVGWAAITGLPGDDDSREHRWESVELLPLNYTQLRLVGADETPAEGEGTGGARSLWQSLARSVLMIELPVEIQSSATVPEDPGEVAQAIAARSTEPGVARAFLGMFSQLAGRIRAQPGRVARAISRSASDMIRKMPPEALDRLVRLGGDAAQRRRMLRDASETLAADVVLDLARVVASSQNHTMSEALLLLLSKLARQAEEGSTARRSASDEALRINVRQLIDDWDGAARLPDESYWAELERLTSAPPMPVNLVSAYNPSPGAVVQVAIDVDLFGITAKHAVADMVKQGRIAELIAIADAAPQQNRVVWLLRRHLDNTRTVRRLLQDDTTDFELLGRLVQRVGFPAAIPLLDALEREEDSQSRWKLFEIVAQLGPDIGEIVVQRLPKGPWFLQRNLLLLMTRLSQWPSEFDPSAYTGHSDARVRREAFALVLTREDSMRRWSRDDMMCRALADGDERIRRAGLLAAQAHGCPESAVPIITQCLGSEPSGALAELMVKVLAPVRSPLVARAFATMVVAPKRRWFRKVPAQVSPAMLAALSVLVMSWRDAPEGAAALGIAGRSEDPAVQRILNRGGAPA